MVLSRHKLIDDSFFEYYFQLLICFMYLKIFFYFIQIKNLICKLLMSVKQRENLQIFQSKQKIFRGKLYIQN